MHCASQTSAQDGALHNHCGELADTSHGSDDDNDVPCGTSSMDNGSDAYSSDPNTNEVQRNSKDATNLANSPSSKESAMPPM